ncbi:Chromobox protein 1 [Dermatophagoides pteronyssinus]|uniref:Chromobox protein 1 n=1 Tax=Dermatophagoides pteronyssinus TaxID=6956 RepID=A0ABQ8JUX5_DERPT|nr:Chromobox protein 1 [Dermatophagoides pteronyssinus]
MDSNKEINLNDDNSIRRSKRIAAKSEEQPNQLIDLIMSDLDRESTNLKKKNDSNFCKRKIYKNIVNNNNNNNADDNDNNKISVSRDEGTGTLFDNGLQAVSIIGATYVDDNDMKSNNELCYLIKYENGQYELVLNKVAHKFCPLLVIDFLESRLSIQDKDDSNILKFPDHLDSNAKMVS